MTKQKLDNVSEDCDFGDYYEYRQMADTNDDPVLNELKKILNCTECRKASPHEDNILGVDYVCGGHKIAARVRNLKYIDKNDLTFRLSCVAHQTEVHKIVKGISQAEYYFYCYVNPQEYDASEIIKYTFVDVRVIREAMQTLQCEITKNVKGDKYSNTGILAIKDETLKNIAEEKGLEYIIWNKYNSDGK